MKRGFLLSNYDEDYDSTPAWPFTEPPPGMKMVSPEEWDMPGKQRMRREDEDTPTMPDDTENVEELAFQASLVHTVEDPVLPPMEDEHERIEEEQLPTQLSAASTGNPYKGIGFMPTSMFGSAKLALNSLYGKWKDEDNNGIAMTDEAFFYWHDDGPAHLRKHTCFFVCPRTYERFPTGRQGEASKYHVGPDGIVWYTKKKDAAHGAAARRYDIYCYRDTIKHYNADATPQNHKYWCLDLPYREGEGPLVEIPIDVEEKIQAQIEKWKEEAAYLKKKRNDNQRRIAEAALGEEEAAGVRQAYRQQRMIVADGSC